MEIPCDRLSAVFDAYLNWAASEGRAARTLYDLRWHLGRFVRFTGDIPIGDLAPSHWWAYAASGARASGHTFRAVRAALAWAVRPVKGRNPERFLDKSPIEGIPCPRPGVNEIDESGCWTWADSRQLIRFAFAVARQEAGNRHPLTRFRRWAKAGILATIAYTGARPAEIAGLKWNEVDFSAGLITLPASRVKTRVARRIPLAPRAIKILVAMNRIQAGHGWSVSSVWGIGGAENRSLQEFWRWIRLELSPYVAKRGFPLPRGWRPYWLRYSWATDAVEAVGADLAASALGHSPEITRAVYDRVTARRIRAVGEAVDRARKAKGKSALRPND